MPGHPRATVGLFASVDPHAGSGEREARREAARHAVQELQRGARPVEAALVSAAERLAVHDAAGAMQILNRLLHEAPSGPAGWIIPVDPMLAGLEKAAGYTNLLGRLAARAV
jgi:hypothetical protein